MTGSATGWNSRARQLRAIIVLALLPAALIARPPLTAKWERFEQAFKSSESYTNPLQQATLTVTFTSPRGQSTTVPGFWDGGKTWRVRFSPDTLGRWTYQTACSDPKNKGLQNKTGEFVCSTPIRPSRFSQHGPLRVARDRRHFEHADGTPFFWLADTAWDAPRLAAAKDWEFYLVVRASQKFSAVQWAVSPGEDARKQSAFTGRQRIAVNPEFFQNLDVKIEALDHAGLLSVIAPLRELNASGANDLPEDQAALLLRYLSARWGANNVAWLLAFDSDRAARWQRIGRAAFGDAPGHAPVVVFSGELSWALDEFQTENWVDAFGFGLGQNVDDDSLKWLVSGPPATAWRQGPAHPILNVLPPLENGVGPGGKRATAEDIRRAAWLAALVAPPAGASYGADGVATWNGAVEHLKEKTRESEWPLWQKSLFLPGAKQMTHLATLFGGIDFWSLQPAPDAVAIQPGAISPRRYVAAADTEAKDPGVVYVPEERTIELQLSLLPLAPAIQWINPRTGEQSPAVAVIGAQTCQLPTPDPGDWVLVMKSGGK